MTTPEAAVCIAAIAAVAYVITVAIRTAPTKIIRRPPPRYNPDDVKLPPMWKSTTTRKRAGK